MKTHDFGAGAVPAHKHTNGGGWVADTASVTKSVIIRKNSVVYDHAKISGVVMVSSSKIFGNAKISGPPRYGMLMISHGCEFFGNATINLKESSRLIMKQKIG
jgi:hypothetical protein